jgi:hypothetical protein
MATTKASSKATTPTRKPKGGAVSPEEFTVERIFPAEKLDRMKVSRNVRSFSPRDFDDMAKAFSVPPQPTDNKKVQALTTADLVAIDGLFADYRTVVISNFQGVNKIARGVGPQNLAADSGSSCCCCCTPCCCCSSAAAMADPFAE